LISPQSAAQPDSARERTRQEIVTPRAVCVGLLMVVFLIWMAQILSIKYRAMDVGASAPPPGTTDLLFFYVLFAAPLLTRLNPRLALSRGELLLVYTMMLVAGPITHPFCIGFLIPHTVSPYHYDTNEPRWAVFQPFLSTWLGPDSEAAVKGFFRGTGGVVPWQAWLAPMLAWSSLLIVLFFVMLCVNVVMRRQWVDNERLSFPLATIPLALTQRPTPGAQCLPDLLCQPLFWLGLALPLAIQAPGALHKYFPMVPSLQLREVQVIDASTQLAPPWNGLGGINFSLIFWLVGVVYLLPKELAFSAWFFYFVALMENVAAVFFGSTGEAPSVYSNDFPALYAQGAGAAFAMTAITLYTARRHLAAVFRKAFGSGERTPSSGTSIGERKPSSGAFGERKPSSGASRDSGVEDNDEFLSYRTAVFGTIGGTAFMLAWLCLAGMRLWIAALLLGLMLAYFFIFARIRAETGMGMGIILWPKMLDEVMVTFVGGRHMTMSDMTLLYALRWLYFGSSTGSVMASQLEGIKLADAGGLRGRRVGTVLALTAVLTTLLAFVWTLKTYYAGGFEQMPIGQRTTSMVGSQIYWSYQNLVETFVAPTGPQWGGILAIGAGALIAMALSWLRMNFLWFPLHPVGFLAANSWGMHINWASFLIGWMLKSLIARYGGLSIYSRLLPLFLGLIAGDLLHQGLWGIVTWATGGQE